MTAIRMTTGKPRGRGTRGKMISFEADRWGVTACCSWLRVPLSFCERAAGTGEKDVSTFGGRRPRFVHRFVISFTENSNPPTPLGSPSIAGKARRGPGSPRLGVTREAFRAPSVVFGPKWRWAPGGPRVTSQRCSFTGRRGQPTLWVHLASSRGKLGCSEAQPTHQPRSRIPAKGSA
jgi:hypothetical protein